MMGKNNKSRKKKSIKTMNTNVNEHLSFCQSMKIDINEKTVHILGVKLLINCCYIVVVSFTDG